MDAIWRAVLARDDAAMAAIDLAAGAVRLLIERRAGEIEVTRIDEPTMELCRSAIQPASRSRRSLEAAAILMRRPGSPSTSLRGILSALRLSRRCTFCRGA